MVGIPIRCDIWQGVAVVGLMVGKAQQWALLVRHRVTLDHQQQAAIRYIWSQTFPESGNLSPVRGRLGGWCLRGQNRISPTPAYRVVASPVIRMGPSTPAPGYGYAEAQWFAIYGPAQSKVVV